jgi:hypothetical protein
LLQAGGRLRGKVGICLLKQENPCPVSNYFYGGGVIGD